MHTAQSSLPPCACRGAFGPRHRQRACSTTCRAQTKAGESQENKAFSAIRMLEQTLREHKKQVSSGAAGLLLAGMLTAGAPSLAADVAKVGTCLLGNCQVALAQCVTDGECLENLICLQKCNGRKDEAACQIRCGDLYQDKAIEAFTACAVSDKKCVPQKVDKDAYPVPPDQALDEQFDLNKFQGRWYITAGLNPLFDQFDCQEHFFGVPEPGKLYGKINWRIAKRDNDFIERSTVQTFKQVADKPAKLENHNNPFLHYTDDWYVLGFKPDEYLLIYYIGNNDAWEGYGGATVYTRAPKLPEELIPEIEEKLKPMHISWDDFKVTDNTCGPHPPPKSAFQRFERFAEDEARFVGDELDKDLRSFGKGFTVLEQNISRELSDDEKAAERELQDAEAFLERLEKGYRAPSFFEAPLRFFTGIFGARPSTAATASSTAVTAPEPAASQAETPDRSGPHTAPCSKSS